MENPERLEFRRSPLKHVGLLLMGALLVAAGGFIITSTEDPGLRIVGWFGVIFFGLAMLAIGRNLFRGGVAIVFDHAGITTDLLPDVRIAWSDLERCHVVKMRSNRFLALTFRDPERFLQRVSTANRKVSSFNARQGWGHWAFTFSGLTPGIDGAVAFIRTNVPHLMAPTDPS